MVERRAKQTEEAAQRVDAYAVDPVDPFESGQPCIAAERTPGTGLESEEEGSIEMCMSAALMALKRGFGENPFYRSPGITRDLAAALQTCLHRNTISTFDTTETRIIAKCCTK